MAYKLTSLPKTQFSGLDYDNILEDIVNLIKENPNYNEDWDDFLSSNAGRMMTELFAYITDQLATRIDWIVNEHYIGTATQKRSVMRMLKLIGYKFKLPIASSVDVSISFDSAFGDYTLTEAYNPNDDNGSFTPYTLTAKDKSGNIRTFECINYNTKTERYDYLSSIILNTGTQTNQNLFHTQKFYEGKTYIETFTNTSDNNPIFELSNKSIIEGSISVFIVQENSSSAIVEAILVDSFLDPEAQKVTDDFGNPINIPYIINVLDEDKVSIEFGPTSLLPNINRRLEEGSVIRIIYRVGGGKNGNITKQAINLTKTYATVIDGNNKIVNITFKNENEGTGGEDSETIEHAAAYAPLSIRTVDKAVTENDYDILLNSHNTILKAKTYGNNNMPENIYEKYGIFIKPLEVWNYILNLKPGWENVKQSEYNDFQWITLRKENRFNEEWYFTDGEFNRNYLVDYSVINEEESIDIDGNGTKTFYDVIYINSSSVLEDKITSPELKLKLTSDRIDDHFFKDLSQYNIVDEKFTTNNGLIENGVYSLYNPINCEIVSSQNISNGITLSQDFNMIIDTYTLTTPVTLIGTSISATSIASQINTQIETQIASGLTPLKGYQTLSFDNNPALTDVTNLLPKTDYYFYVNEEEFKITTGSSAPTYAELQDLINNSFKFLETTGKITFGSYDITEIEEIELLEKGYKFTIDEDIYSTSSLDIIDIFIGEKRFRVSVLGDHTDTANLTFYKYLCEYDDVNYEFKITNNKQTPYEAIILRPGKSGLDLLTAINPSHETLDIPANGGNVKGSFNFGLNVTLTDIAGITDGTYNFKINNYDYTIVILSTDTYNDIITKINAIVQPNFECVGDTNDIKLNSIAYNYIELGNGNINTDLVYALHGDEYKFTNEGKGGGDYSSIISVYYGTNGSEYLKAKSPSKGYVSSQIKLESASNNLFGLTRTNKLFRGKLGINVITNGTDVGKIIIECGKINIPETFKTIYLNYLDKTAGVIEIGKYFYNNYSQSDIKWRSIADRIYNTVYDDNNNIDFKKSNFEIRFTKEPVDKNSIYAITSDWDLEQSSPAFVESQDVSNIIDLSSEYMIKIGLDGGVPVEIDLTGNNGTTVNPSPNLMIGLINTALNDTYLTTGIRYATFNEVNNKITISSDSYKNGSKVTLYKPTSNDATNKFFDLNILDVGDIYEYNLNGDYYLEYTNEVISNNQLTGAYSGRNYLKLIPVTISEKIPDLKFYVSFIFDQTIIEEIYDGETEETSYDGSETYIVGTKYGDLDEDVYKSYLELKKIVGINNIFKETVFSTFDIAGTIYYDKLFSKTTIQETIENKLYDEYSLEKRDYTEIVSRSKIMKLLHEVEGVDFVEIDYLGKNYINQGEYPTQDNTIKCEFDEIIVLSEKRYSFGTLIHGPIFNFKPSES